MCSLCTICFRDILTNVSCFLYGIFDLLDKTFHGLRRLVKSIAHSYDCNMNTAKLVV